MKIELSEKIAAHLTRVENLAIEAESDDTDDTVSGRASAMNSLSRILSDLVKTQTTIYNIERLQKIENALIEVAKQYLSEEKIDQMLDEIEAAYELIE